VLALALFAVGVVEYTLAALWTRVVVTRRAGATALVTFVNVLLWGFVITSLEPGNPGLLVIHGAGCALGAAASCWIGADEVREVSPRPARRLYARRATARARRRPVRPGAAADRGRTRGRARYRTRR
jgi:hypothetical protein